MLFRSRIAAAALACTFASVAALNGSAAPAAKASAEAPKFDIDPNSGELIGGPQVPALKPSEYTALGKLPDWSGDWGPNIAYMAEQNKTIQPPWNAEGKRQVQVYLDGVKSGKPIASTPSRCLPTGMPALMNQNHTFEFWFVPRRIFIFNEIDNTDMRRIYTDGRALPEDPDLSYMGYSVGHWEGKTLIVETIGVLPEVPFRVNDRYNVENGGDQYVLEHIYLKDEKTLVDDLEVKAPKVLTGPWKYSRQFIRHREPFFEIVESVCEQSGYDTVDSEGKAYFNFERHNEKDK